ncbi:MAG: caspase family protein [Gammaproteobacteria bacterium]|nr:caspase family protein [Gammaproteobacteria bacterium]
MANKPFISTFIIGVLLLTACSSSGDKKQEQEMLAQAAKVTPQNINKVFIVDCLLPGQVRRIGSSVNYISPRRPIRTSAIDCEIRGGEYVAFDRSDYATALKIWMPQAQQGDPEAQTNVGEIYEKGMGIVPDYDIAAVWYKKAAKQGYSRAQINLGYLYEKGLGVKQDLAEAMNWYRKASGLPEEIEFISSVELAAKNVAITELKGEVERLQKESDELKKRLDGVQNKLNKTHSKQKNTKAQIAQLNEKIKALEAKSEATLNANNRETTPFPEALQALHSQLQKRQAELQQQGLLIATLKQESQSYRSKIAEIQTSQQMAMAAPTIEIIDPPLALTRGIPGILLRSAVTQKEIFGKVNAPAGIKEVLYNKNRIGLSASNTFRFPVDVSATQTKVEIVAIDKRERQASLDFTITRPATLINDPFAGSGKKIDVKGADIGSYYALIIGNNDYTNLPQLKTAINDAKSVDEVLRNKYGFKTKLLVNANRYQILAALHDIRKTLDKDDNFLIYYAGHGDLDQSADRGYWLPVDADLNNTANWISNVAITDMLNTLPAKHVMVIADSCYSGTMTRTAVPRMDTQIPADVQEKWLKLMSKTRSRTALTSGGVQPVLDSGGNNHSIFAEVFLNTLKNNQGLLQGYSLYRQISQGVSARSGQFQTPEYAPIKHSGHETGQFFFVAS